MSDTCWPHANTSTPAAAEASTTASYSGNSHAGITTTGRPPHSGRSHACQQTPPQATGQQPQVQVRYTPSPVQRVAAVRPPWATVDDLQPAISSTPPAVAYTQGSTPAPASGHPLVSPHYTAQAVTRTIEQQNQQHHFATPNTVQTPTAAWAPRQSSSSCQEDVCTPVRDAAASLLPGGQLHAGDAGCQVSRGETVTRRMQRSHSTSTSRSPSLRAAQQPAHIGLQSHTPSSNVCTGANATTTNAKGVASSAGCSSSASTNVIKGRCSTACSPSTSAVATRASSSAAQGGSAGKQGRALRSSSVPRQPHEGGSAADAAGQLATGGHAAKQTQHSPSGLQRSTSDQQSTGQQQQPQQRATPAAAADLSGRITSRNQPPRKPWSPPLWNDGAASPSNAADAGASAHSDSVRAADAGASAHSDSRCAASRVAAAEQQATYDWVATTCKDDAPVTLHLPGGALGAGATAHAPDALQRKNTKANLSAASQVQVAALESEAAALRQEVADLKALLGVVQAADELQAPAKPGGSAALHAQQQPTALARSRSQCWQLQRQLALIATELQAQTNLVALAENSLLEVCTHLDTLTAGSAYGQQACKPRLHSQHSSSRTEAAHTEQQQQQSGSWELDIDKEQLAAISSWAHAIQHRITSERAQVAKKLGRQGLQQQQQQQHYAGSSTGAAWELPWTPVGGNTHLAASMAAAAAVSQQGRRQSQNGSDQLASVQQASCKAQSVVALSLFSLPNIAVGLTAAALSNQHLQQNAQHAGTAAAASTPTSSLLPQLSAMPAAAQQLESQLERLSPQLSSLAVLLRTVVLPALPWLSQEASDRVQAEVAETASAVATAGRNLSQITSLLPAGPATLHAACEQAKARASQVQAGRDSWMYADCTQQVPVGSQHVDEHARDCGLDVAAVVAAVRQLVAKERKPPAAHTLHQLLHTLLDAPLRASATRQALLEQELHFCCRTVALQAQHVAHLIQTVQQEVAAVLCQASPQPSVPSPSGSRVARNSSTGDDMQQHMQAISSLLQALDDLDRQPTEANLAFVVSQLQASKAALAATHSMLAAAPARELHATDGHAGQHRLLACLADTLATLHPAFDMALQQVQQARNKARAT